VTDSTRLRPGRPRVMNANYEAAEGSRMSRVSGARGADAQGRPALHGRGGFLPSPWLDLYPSVFGYHEVFHAHVCAAATCQFVWIALFIR
jgi:predicted membrane channel-forming protein YqfA (hemolysin III family)